MDGAGVEVQRQVDQGSTAKRSHTLWAALTEICWPTMERASVVKASPRERSVESGNSGISRFITRSLRARCLQASAQ